MDIMRNLKYMTFQQVLCSSSAYKKIAIQMLINALNEDAAYNVLAHKETEKEYLTLISRRNVSKTPLSTSRSKR